MPIAKVSKITLFIPNEKKDTVVRTLHELECVEIISPNENPQSAENIQSHIRAQSAEYSSMLDKLKHTIDTITKYEYLVKARAVVVNVKYCVTPEEEVNTALGYNWVYFYEKINELLGKIAALELRKSMLQSTISELAPWAGVSIALRKLADSKYLRFEAGHISATLWHNFENELRNLPIVLRLIQTDSRNVYFGLIYSPSQSAELKKIHHKYGYTQILYPKLSATPAKIIRRFGQEVSGHSKKIKRYYEEIADYVSELPKLKIVYDHVLKNRSVIESQRSMLSTRYNAYFRAWIISAKIDKLKQLLKDENIIFHCIIESPGKGDDIPILLRNNRLIEPFEVVTNLYGKPNYGEADPTPFLAPFFALFFGICMADAAYGIIMFTAAIIPYRRAKSVSVKKFLKLIIWCGAMTTIIGVLTGGYFGDLLDRFPIFAFTAAARRELILLDPINESLKFLGITLLLGLIQTIFGTTLKVYQSFRERNISTVFLSDLPVLGIQVAFPFIILSAMFGVELVPVRYPMFLLGFSAVLIMVNQWLLNEGVVLKLFQMFFSVYGAITGNALSDPLSYSRLFALSLSTYLLAMAFNEIASLFFAAPYIGFLLGSGFLLIGHSFNLAIGSLGAYVHTSRLQYLEFFNKFFVGGGREMKPLRWQKKYTV